MHTKQEFKIYGDWLTHNPDNFLEIVIKKPLVIN